MNGSQRPCGSTACNDLVAQWFKGPLLGQWVFDSVKHCKCVLGPRYHQDIVEEFWLKNLSIWS